MAPGGGKILCCFSCALKYTLHGPPGSVSIEQKLSRAERTKKASLENFLRRVDLFVECLSNSKLSGERKQIESYQRYQNDATKITNFFNHVLKVFIELYEKLVNERTSRYNIVKEDHEEKLKLLQKQVTDLTDLRADIVLNFDNILVCMEEEPFSKIMKKYGSSVDHIQKMFEDQKLDQFPVYEDTVENLRGMDKINETLQTCLNQIHRTFENNLLSSSVSVSLLVDGGHNALNEELKKINDCFYNNSMLRSSASIDMYSRVHHDPSPTRPCPNQNSFILEMTSSKSIKLAHPPSAFPKSPKEALRVLPENPEETDRLSLEKVGSCKNTNSKQSEPDDLLSPSDEEDFEPTPRPDFQLGETSSNFCIPQLMSHPEPTDSHHEVSKSSSKPEKIKAKTPEEAWMLKTAEQPNISKDSGPSDEVDGENKQSNIVMKDKENKQSSSIRLKLTQVCSDSPELSPVASASGGVLHPPDYMLGRIQPDTTPAIDLHVPHDVHHGPDSRKLLNPDASDVDPHLCRDGSPDPDNISPSNSGSNPSPGILEFSSYGFGNQPAGHLATQVCTKSANQAIQIQQYGGESDDEDDEHQGEVNVRDVDAGMREFYGDNHDEHLPFKNYADHHLMPISEESSQIRSITQIPSSPPGHHSTLRNLRSGISDKIAFDSAENLLGLLEIEKNKVLIPVPPRTSFQMNKHHTQSDRVIQLSKTLIAPQVLNSEKLEDHFKPRNFSLEMVNEEPSQLYGDSNLATPEIKGIRNIKLQNSQHQKSDDDPESELIKIPSQHQAFDVSKQIPSLTQQSEKPEHEQNLINHKGLEQRISHENIDFQEMASELALKPGHQDSGLTLKLAGSQSPEPYLDLKSPLHMVKSYECHQQNLHQPNKWNKSDSGTGGDKKRGTNSTKNQDGEDESMMVDIPESKRFIETNEVYSHADQDHSCTIKPLPTAQEVPMRNRKSRQNFLQDYTKSSLKNNHSRGGAGKGKISGSQRLKRKQQLNIKIPFNNTSQSMSYQGQEHSEPSNKINNSSMGIAHQFFGESMSLGKQIRKESQSQKRKATQPHLLVPPTLNPSNSVGVGQSLSRSQSQNNFPIGCQMGFIASHQIQAPRFSPDQYQIVVNTIESSNRQIGQTLNHSPNHSTVSSDPLSPSNQNSKQPQNPQNSPSIFSQHMARDAFQTRQYRSCSQAVLKNPALEMQHAGFDTNNSSNIAKLQKHNIKGGYATSSGHKDHNDKNGSERRENRLKQLDELSPDVGEKNNILSTSDLLHIKESQHIQSLGRGLSVSQLVVGNSPKISKGVSSKYLSTSGYVNHTAMLGQRRKNTTSLNQKFANQSVTHRNSSKAALGNSLANNHTASMILNTRTLASTIESGSMRQHRLSPKISKERALAAALLKKDSTYFRDRPQEFPSTSNLGGDRNSTTSPPHTKTKFHVSSTDYSKPATKDRISAAFSKRKVPTSINMSSEMAPASKHAQQKPSLTGSFTMNSQQQRQSSNSSVRLTADLFDLYNEEHTSGAKTTTQSRAGSSKSTVYNSQQACQGISSAKKKFTTKQSAVINPSVYARAHNSSKLGLLGSKRDDKALADGRSDDEDTSGFERRDNIDHLIGQSEAVGANSIHANLSSIGIGSARGTASVQLLTGVNKEK